MDMNTFFFFFPPSSPKKIMGCSETPQDQCPSAAMDAQGLTRVAHGWKVHMDCVTAECDD